MTSIATIDKLDGVFASYALSKTLISANGPQLVSQYFIKFKSGNGINRIKTNGQCERFVQTVKHFIDRYANITLRHKIANFLFSYRNHPPPKPPPPKPSYRNHPDWKDSIRFFLGRAVRTKFSLVRQDQSVKSGKAFNDRRLYLDMGFSQQL